jgi:PAS domain-containing protein
MRFFLHILADGRRIADPSGAEFESIGAARAEALQSARDLIADRLRQGLGAVCDWHVEIADANGRVMESLPIDQVLLGAPLLDRHRRLYQIVPHCYLLLSPDFSILEANPAYLDVTMTDLARISRRDLFDIFPDNPGDPEADGVRNVTASLHGVIKTKQAHTLAHQRYDLRRRDGSWERRHWRAQNLPVLDQNGEISFILHHVEDITRQVLATA